MFRLILSIICIFTFTTTALSQYSVYGTVTDSTYTGEPYATLRIYNNTNKEKPVKIGVTDIDGKFEQELSSTGKYEIEITSMGKLPLKKEFEITSTQKSVNLDPLVMQNNATTLAGVEVVAQKPLISTEIDRICYDIKSDEESKTNNIFDMLRKVPMVTIDGNDNILVNGSSNFKIYKNGRPNSGWSNNPKDVLKSIPASMIKRIEVITEPGAKYDAEGVSGILNIITDDSAIFNGIAGSIGANANTNDMHGANAYFTTQTGKFTTSIIYNYSTLGKANTTPHMDSELTYTETGNHFIRSTDNSIESGGIHYGNIEASYEIDSLNLLSLSFDGYLFKLGLLSVSDESMLDNTYNPIYSYSSTSRFPKYQYFDFNGKLDFQHLTKNKGEALTLSYLISTTNQEQITENHYTNLVNFPLDYDKFNTNNKLNFYEHTFQFDWTRPFAEKHKAELGLKYILRQNFSETLNQYNNGNSFLTDFDHITHIGAAYGEYSYNAEKWGARAGLRYEFAHLNGEYHNSDKPAFHSNIGDIVPTLSFNYKINPFNNLKLNYATRINRPGISYLNPAIEETPRSIQHGNPNLESTRHNSVRISYSLTKAKIVLSTSANYTWANNVISSIKTFKDGITESTYDNIGKEQTASLNAYLQWSATKSTQIVFNGTLENSRYSNIQNLSNQAWGGNFYANISQKLPWKLLLNINCNYWNGGALDVYSKVTTSRVMYGLNLSRSFLKEDRLTVKIGIQNPFEKYTTTVITNVQGVTTGPSTYNNLGRAFGLNIAYRFGKLKASVKKTNKTISNDDLQGRK